MASLHNSLITFVVSNGKNGGTWNAEPITLSQHSTTVHIIVIKLELETIGSIIFMVTISLAEKCFRAANVYEVGFTHT